MLLTRAGRHGRILVVERFHSAALAQLVERRLGKAEVGGSNPLGSSPETGMYDAFRFFCCTEDFARIFFVVQKTLLESFI